jgi:lysozyme
MFDQAKLSADLERDEDFKSLVYDDASGKPIVPGWRVQGHPTIGIGWALDVTPLSLDRARVIMGWHIADKSAELFAALPWMQSLDEVRCRALVNMCFQMGVAGVLGFKNTVALLQAGRFGDAAAEMEKSTWANQTPARAQRIADMIRTGQDGPLIA